MKKLLKITILIIAYVLVSACKKQLEFEILESRCKDFKISNSIVDKVNNACTNIKSNTLKVRFTIDGDTACLVKIIHDTKFYNSNREEVLPKSITISTLPKNDSKVSINGNSVEFIIDFEMNTQQDYENLSYGIVNFTTENSTGGISNRLSGRVQFCTAALPPAISNNTIQVKNPTVTVTLFDNASNDGDLITILLNGVVVQQNVEIFNTPKSFVLQLNPNIRNVIEFYAVNEGLYSPNTASGTVNDGVSTQNFDLGMKQGESIYFDLQIVK